MKVDALLSLGLDVLLDQFGEDIEIQDASEALPVAVRALVDDTPTLQAIGQTLTKQITVTVRRGDITRVTAGHARVFLPPAEEFGARVEYLVKRVRSRDANYLDLTCVR